MQKNKPKRNVLPIGYLILALVIVIYYVMPKLVKPNEEQLGYSQFKEYITQGRITECFISKNFIRGKYRGLAFEDGSGQDVRFRTTRVEDPNLATNLQEQGVNFRGEIESNLKTMLMWWIFPFALMAFFWYFLFNLFFLYRYGSNGFFSRV